MTDRSNEALSRSLVYRLLSRALLTEPTASFLAGLAEPSVLRVLSKVGGGWMARLPETDLQALADELATEYARLFVGPGYHLPPYESMHVAADSPHWEGPDAQLFGRSAIAVGEFYRLAAIEASPSFRGLPDHVGVELEFMSHLSAREVRCWEREDAEGAISSLVLQRKFLRQHLVPWLPRFARKVRRFDAHPFYCAVTSAASRFVRVDLRTVDDILLSERQEPDEEMGELDQPTTVRSHRRQ